jgi:ceramide glucosyltransferase
LNAALGVLALLSLVLLVWQWLAGCRFPLHQRGAGRSSGPVVTLLKPLKGSDSETEACLRSWFAQDYSGRVQILFGVASADDPACAVVRTLMAQFPAADARLIVCSAPAGPNAKVAKLIELERLAKYDRLVISDADVRVPRDLLSNLAEPFRDSGVGLVNCFYFLANPSTLPMHWEAIAVNADFWSQVLQARSLRPMDFALGAVMATRRDQLKKIGGFQALVNCLADDYQLGHRIAQLGSRLELSTIVVECCSAPMGWREVWKHQLRWARTIRVCQPIPYFFSVLSNAGLWPLVWLVAAPSTWSAAFTLASCLLRIGAALHLQARLTRRPGHFVYWWLVPIKDLLQAAIWLLAFLGHDIEWRGQRMRLRKDGTLAPSTKSEILPQGGT